MRDFVRLAAADEKCRSGLVRLPVMYDRFGACRTRQQGQFFETGGKVTIAEIDAD